METTRRRALQTALGAGMLAMAPHRRATGQSQGQTVSSDELLRVAEAPVLQLSDLTAPVTITEMELLRNRRNFVVRVRAKEGAEGLAVPPGLVRPGTGRTVDDRSPAGNPSGGGSRLPGLDPPLCGALATRPGPRVRGRFILRSSQGGAMIKSWG